MNTLLPWCFLLPLPFLVLSALRLPARAGLISAAGPVLVLACALAYLLGPRAPIHVDISGWVPFLPDASFRLMLDGLAAVMLAVVGFVATCVYVYSIAYMHDDERAHRFFAFLDLFVATMCLLVVAGNLTVLLVGWTGVGISSFLLISFWWQRGHPLQAGFLALGANAIGDAALLLACVLLPAGGGALDGLAKSAQSATGGPMLVGALLVVAACAKSAQGPLWWWLPSAMAGPTPVSALIHAATMVAAGVYLLVRTHAVIALSPEVSWAVVLVGMSTAIGGGLASLWQANFKRGIAYSTASQLGWMFVAVGLGAPFAAFFHLVTHASFKAMMFLSAGTVIHACHHEEDVRALGGLRKHLPGAHAFFLLGCLAIIGTPFLAGSFSKDAILEAAHAFQQAPWVFYALCAGAVLTGAYAGRLYSAVFLGAEGKGSHHAHAHKGHLGAFDAPLVPLAIGAVTFGYLEAGTHVLSGVLTGLPATEVHLMPTTLGLVAFALGALGFGAGIWLGQTKEKRLPVFGGTSGLDVISELRYVPVSVTSLHAGSVGRYLVLSVAGAALLGLLVLRAPVMTVPANRADAATTRDPRKPVSPPPAGTPPPALPGSTDLSREKLKALKEMLNKAGEGTPRPRMVPAPETP
jgi:NADH-quinone oxidoreductase subunit L